MAGRWVSRNQASNGPIGPSYNTVGGGGDTTAPPPPPPPPPPIIPLVPHDITIPSRRVWSYRVVDVDHVAGAQRWLQAFFGIHSVIDDGEHLIIQNTSGSPVHAFVGQRIVYVEGDRRVRALSDEEFSEFAGLGISGGGCW